MLPTFNEAGDIVVVDCLHVKMGRALQKGDIVIAKSPTNPGNTVCKRVLGLVRAGAGNVFVFVGGFYVCDDCHVIYLYTRTHIYHLYTARGPHPDPAAVLVPAGAGHRGAWVWGGALFNIS